MRKPLEMHSASRMQNMSQIRARSACFTLSYWPRTEPLTGQANRRPDGSVASRACATFHFEEPRRPRSPKNRPPENRGVRPFEQAAPGASVATMQRALFPERNNFPKIAVPKTGNPEVAL